MGGTYWYYYRLDDEIEFHNSVEPSSTQCPLLPGQIVNELNVPVVLSGNRSRNTSVSSTSSERRTMNPTDKFVNPRPVPKPQLARLKTSPTLTQGAFPSTSTPQSTRSGRSGTVASVTSEPGSADTVRHLRGTKKLSLDPPSRSSSRANSPASALSNGLRSAFKSFRSPRSASADTAPGIRNSSPDRYIEHTRSASSEGYIVREPRSWGASRDHSPKPRSQGGLDHDLAFRKLVTSPDGSIETVAPQSFQQHRRQRSSSREPSSLRNSLVLEDPDVLPLREVGYPSKQPLSTLKEVASTQNTPGMPLTGTLGADLEKRLPTLPNSPSSAYPISAADDEKSKRGSMDMDQLQSHFSTTTIDTTDSVHSSPAQEDFHRFSGWSSSVYPDTSRSSVYATSFIDDEPMSAVFQEGTVTPRREQNPREGDITEFEETPPKDYPRRDDSLPTFPSSSTVSSTAASSLSTSPSEYDPRGDHWQLFSEKPERFYYQRYQLPALGQGSEVTLKQPSQENINETQPQATTNPFGIVRDHSSGNMQATLPHSNNMQHLLDELSYLGEMIHQT